MLLGLLLRVARTVADLHAVHQHRTVEHRVVRSRLLVEARAERDLVAVLLTPLDQAALEVVLRFGELLEVEQSEVDAVDQQPSIRAARC